MAIQCQEKRDRNIVPRFSSDDPNTYWIQLWSCWLVSTEECLLIFLKSDGRESTAANLEQMGDKAERRLTVGKTMEDQKG